MRNHLRAFVTAAQFLTRLPVPDLGLPKPEDLARSQGFYPVIGLIVGLLLAAGAYEARLVFGAPLFGAILAVALDAYLSGGMHLDGLMDTADGLLSYRSRERALEIMRDSRVGAMGVLAVVFVLMLRVGTLATLSTRTLMLSLLLGAMLSRTLLLLVMRYSRSAREDGLGRQVAGHVQGPVAWVSSVAVSLITWYLLGIRGLYGLAAMMVVIVWFVSTCHRRLGGMTGDTYGALIELSQLAFAIGVIAHIG